MFVGSTDVLLPEFVELLELVPESSLGEYTGKLLKYVLFPLIKVQGWN